MAMLVAAGLPATAVAGAYLHSATFDSESGSTAVVLGLSAPVAARVYTLEKPHRVVIDLPAVQGAAVGYRVGHALLRFHLGHRNHLAPLVLLRLLECGQLLGAAAHRHGAQVGQAFGHGGLLQGGVHFG